MGLLWLAKQWRHNPRMVVILRRNRAVAVVAMMEKRKTLASTSA